MRKLTHLNTKGEVSMVDVGGKSPTRRRAVATGRLFASREVIEAVLEQRLQKGDLFAAAKIAGIQGGKLTSSLIPLCHPLNLDKIDIRIEVDGPDSFLVSAEARSTGRTGVEMEALTAVAVACLTIYDMCKSIDRTMTITEIRLEEKSGGKSGSFRRQQR